MITALLPVKSFHRSKQRLTGFLTPQERIELARTMFDDVWATLEDVLNKAKHFEQLLVATSEPYVISRCQDRGIPCLVEEEQLSHTASVERATEWAVSRGATTLLSVPIDTPGVTGEEIAAILKAGESHQVVVVPSADGLGTNALLRRPPAAIKPHFGPDSCRLHSEAARANGLLHQVLPLPGFAADIDTPEDLQFFSQIDRDCKTRSLALALLSVRRGAAPCL